jgi:hypothetical protein
MKNVIFEQKKIKLWGGGGEQYFAGNKTKIMQHVLKMQ